MAVAIAWKTLGPKATAANYDALILAMGVVPGGQHPGAGALFHWVRVAQDGLHGVDVWQSQAQFNTFAENMLGPESAKLGLPAPITQSYDIHNYLTAHP
jgi:hypothetical protein